MTATIVTILLILLTFLSFTLWLKYNAACSYIDGLEEVILEIEANTKAGVMDSETYSNLVLEAQDIRDARAGVFE